jgi:hypothetical protein
MGVFLFNWRGLFATVLVAVPAFYVMGRLEDAGWSVGALLCFLAIATTLPLSLYAYTIDRCDRPGVLRPYWDNFLQVCAEAYSGTSSDYNPERRTAFCFLPLAVGPYVVFLVYLGTWIYWLFTGDATTLLPYLACTAASCVVAAAYGKLTESRRLIIIELPD